MAEWNFKNMHENLTWHNSDVPSTWQNTDSVISSGRDSSQAFGDKLVCKVTDTRLSKDDGGSCTQYLIEVETNLKEFGLKQRFGVWKRYNEFKTLYETLKQLYPANTLPEFPKKNALSRYNKEVIAQRFFAFQRFLDYIASDERIRADKSFRLFLGVS